MATANLTPEEMESELGENLRRLRLNKNLDQKTVAERSGISVRALRNLEGGQGSTVKTLIVVLRTLGREEWLQTVAPVATINPLILTRAAHPICAVREEVCALAYSTPFSTGLLS